MFQINNDVSFKKFKRNEYIISVLFIGLVILFYLFCAIDIKYPSSFTRSLSNYTRLGFPNVSMVISGTILL